MQRIRDTREVCQGYTEACWQGVSATRLCYLKEDGEELLPGLSRDLLLFFAILRCAFMRGLLPGGGGDGRGDMFQPPAVCRAGDDDSNHRRAQGICTRMVLALAGRDAMNFWPRPTAALLARTFILSSPARGRGSARRGQPLPTARSRVGRAASGPFTIGLFQGLPKGEVLVWCSAFF